jgi:glutathione S-transferase
MDLFDSPVICEYLDTYHKGRKLIPRKGRERWVALRLQAMADGLLDAALLARYEGFLRPEDKRWPDWTKGQMKKIEGVLDTLEAEAKSLKGKLTIGTISVVSALGYLDFRFGSHDWRSSRPKLAKWFATVSKTPSVKATVPPPA